MLYEVITFIKFLYWKKRISGLRILMQFCVKDYERTAAVSAAYLGIMENALKKGYRITSYNVCYTKLLRM